MGGAENEAKYQENELTAVKINLIIKKIQILTALAFYFGLIRSKVCYSEMSKITKINLADIEPISNKTNFE